MILDDSLLASLTEGIGHHRRASKYITSKKDAEEHCNTPKPATKIEKGDVVGLIGATTLTIISVLFSDQDECQTGNHNCSHLAECTNTQGSYNCLCYSGTTGNGFICSGV